MAPPRRRKARHDGDALGDGKQALAAVTQRHAIQGDRKPLWQELIRPGEIESAFSSRRGVAAHLPLHRIGLVLAA
jgi:hypothetical protein